MTEPHAALDLAVTEGQIVALLATLIVNTAVEQRETRTAGVAIGPANVAPSSLADVVLALVADGGYVAIYEILEKPS